MLEALEDALKRLGAMKVKKIRQRECVLLAAEIGSEIYLISIAKGGMTNNYVGKIVPSVKLSDWTCIGLEYSPYGLYVLADSVDSLVGKVISKLQLLMSSHTRHF